MAGEHSSPLQAFLRRNGGSNYFSLCFIDISPHLVYNNSIQF